MAAQGAIEPDEEDTSTAIAAILTLGAIALVTFPAIGHLLHMGQQAYGMWAGLAVDNTAESVATGSLYGQDAGRWAILAKTARSSFIGFVVLGYAVYWASQGQAAVVEHKALFLWQKFPKFILGFLAISFLATAGFFTKGQLDSLSSLSQLGLPACLRRGRIAHQPEGPGGPGLASAGGGHSGRSLHRHHHARPGLLELQPRSRAMTSARPIPAAPRSCRA